MNANKIVFQFVSISFSILIMLLVLIGFVKLGSYCYDFGYHVFTEAPMEREPGRDVVIQLSKDMSDMDIAKELEKKGLVRDAKLFYVQLKVSAYSKKLNEGVFTLNTSMEPRDMMVAMAAKKEETKDNTQQIGTDNTKEEDTGTTEQPTTEAIEDAGE